MKSIKSKGGPGGGIERMTERFQNMSEEEKIQFKFEMIEKFGGGGPGGGRGPDGGKRGGK